MSVIAAPADFALGPLGLEPEPALDTAVILSLLCDRRATPAELEAFGRDADPRGWCGDALATAAGDRWGSGLWLLERQKQTEPTRLFAEAEARAALQWLIEDGWADALTVAAAWRGLGRLEIEVAVTAGGETRRLLVERTFEPGEG